MKVILAFDLNEARKKSWEDNFPKTTKCYRCSCKGKSRLGFVAYEEWKKDGRYVYQIYKNKPEKLWLFQCCCVAVYFCEKCLEPTALYNQA